MAARFVAVGIGHYRDSAWAALPAALTDIDKLTPYFVGGGLEASCLTDCTEQEIVQELNRLLPPTPGSPAGTLVLYWSGHGQVPRDGGLRLIAADTLKQTASLLTASYITSVAAHSGAAHILLIFDTCYSGAASASVISTAIAVLASLEGNDLWVGMIAAAMDWQRAGDGRFGARLARLLEKGPDDVRAHLWWSEQNEGITADALIYALLADWDDKAGQHPEQTQWGRGLPDVVVRNPLFSAAAPARVVEQLVDAARGGQQGEEWYFAGRQQVLAKLAGWITADQPGVKVLTGPPGSGKSAVLGQLLCLSDPALRREILRQGPIESADPGEGTIHAHLAARGITVKQAVRAIDEQLSDRGIIPNDRRGRRGRGELLDAAEAAVRPVIVIDGLDEAGSEAWQMVDQLIRPLSVNCLFVVGTRELADPDGGAPLIARLQPDSSQVISLLAEADDDADVRTYVRHRLRDRDDRMGPDLVATSVIAQRARPDEGLFLLARILTAQLRAEPVDTASPGWQWRLSHSVEEAFDRDLETVPPLERGDGQAIPGAARDLLTALAWSFGAGLPDDLWAAIAGAISGRAYTTAEMYFALEATGRYIIEEGDGGRAVYRLAHQRLVSHLRSATPERAPEAIAAVVTRIYGQLLDSGNDLSRYRYLVRFTWRHCVEGGIPGLGLLGALGANHPDQVRPDVAVAFRWFGEHRMPADDTTVTIRAFEEARAAYAALTVQDIGYSADLARTLDGLGVAYSWARRPEAVQATSDGTEMFRLLSEANPSYLPDYASALTHLGMRYDEAARFEEALDTIRKATKIYDHLAQENSAYRPGLATATLNLSLAYSNLHQDRDAAEVAMQAFIAFTELTRENPGYRSELARAGANVAARFAAINEMTMALAAAESSVELLTKLSAENPGQRAYLAEALNTAGNVYSAAGNLQEALSSARQAVDLLRDLTATDPRQRPNFALALSNLSNREATAGHASDAVAPALEAAAILREDTAAHPSRTVDLAGSLVNLSIRLEESDPQAAGQAANEAIQLCVGLPPDAKTYRVLASAFNSASRALRRMGRPAEAADAAANAVQVYQQLVVTGQAPLGHLLGALTTLTRAYLETGDQAAAEAAWQQAREASDDPETKVQFLVAEAKVVRPDRARAALVEAGVLLESPSVLTFQVRQLLRARYRAEPDALTRAWTERIGGPVPRWMGLDPDLCQAVLAWFTAPDLGQTKARHAANLDRFATEEALAAFDEVAPMVIDDDEVIRQYRETMIAARNRSLDELYPGSD
jgi:tetratricopeptide (TPR) repeat protein